MTGKELYEKYKRIHAQNGLICDEWDDLEESERNVWIALAIEISI